MATRTLSAGRAAARLWVFVPPRRLLPGTAKLAGSTIVGFAALGADGKLQSGEAPIAALPRSRRIELVFDAGDVFQATVAAPRLSDAKLRLALPNLLEDRLLAEPADCHFAFAAPARGGTASLPVAVIDRGLLTRLLDVFAAAGERPRAAYSGIYLLPPPSPDRLSVRVDGGRLLARTGLHEGAAFDFDGAEPPAALPMALRKGGWTRIRAYGAQASQLEALAATLGVAVELADRPIDADAPAEAINLLQGAFARGGLFGNGALPRLSARAWRAPLAWIAVAAAVFVVGMNGYWMKLRAESAELRERMTTAFRGAFADAEMVDPVLQAQRELLRLRARAGQSSAGDFTSLNALAAQVFASAPVGIVSSVEYRDAALQVQFKAPPNGPLQNLLRVQAAQLGVQMRFAPDGTAHITAAGG